ncbi:MAG: flagellin [Rhizomicrobium sp.]|nr:flagellin [Rhizomicrobium sp.]
MSVDRVATSSQTNYMLTQIGKANANLQQSETQVASGKVSDTYAGYGAKTAALEGARAAAQKSQAYQDNTNLAVTQTDLQDTQLTTLSGLASQLKSTVTSAIGNSDGTNLMSTADGIFQQAAAILNSTDANGNYIYGGSVTDKPPFTATKLSDLAPSPPTPTPSISSFFQNDTIKKSVQVGDGQTQSIGVLASDIGTTLMTSLQSLYNIAVAPTGTDAYKGSLTATQTDALSTQVLPTASTAATDLNAATALNGDTYNSLKSAVTSQQTINTMYSGFVSDIEQVDMPTALAKLSLDQTALQAVLTVTSKLNNLSLLNFMPSQ